MVRSGETLPDQLPLLKDDVLGGIGSGGPGFNNYRPDEMTFLIELTRDLKAKALPERRHIVTDYEAFVAWIESVHREGSRQFRHMLRFFTFPDRVERISSNNDRQKILAAFGVGALSETRNWSDRQLDDALFTLRAELEKNHQGDPLDFYSSALKERWAQDRKVKTPEGEVTVVVPGDDEEEAEDSTTAALKPPEARQSIRTQAKLAEIGAIMGFKIWVPAADRVRVMELVQASERGVEAPRGTEFLFNPNRFNVAISRAQCLALVVHGAALLDGAWTKIDDLRRLNLFAHAEALALRAT